MSFFDDQVYFANLECIQENYRLCPICQNPVRYRVGSYSIHVSCDWCEPAIGKIVQNGIDLYESGITAFSDASYDKVTYKRSTYYRTFKESIFVNGVFISKIKNLDKRGHQFKIGFSNTSFKLFTIRKFIKKYNVNDWSIFIKRMQRLSKTKVML